MDFEDKTIVCADCQTEFVHSAADQARYSERGLTNDPKRCAPCREKRRNRQPSKPSGGPGGGGGGGHGGPRGGDSGPRGRAGRFFSASENRPRRESFPATCAACGQQTTVPFKPVEGRPVYCRDCYQSSHGNR